MASDEGANAGMQGTTGIDGIASIGQRAIERVADSGIDFKRFYTELNESEKLQLYKHEVDWLQRYSEPTRPVDVVLSFGCGVQSVPHLMLAQVAIFKTLGIDFVATAGQAYCCGSVMRFIGNAEGSKNVAHTSIKRFASWQPRVNVHQCGSCHMQFSSRLDDIEKETGSRPFHIAHITEFLRNTLMDMGDAVPWKNTPRVRYLLHAEGSEVHASKASARTAIIEALACIPGVEFAGLLEDPSIGSPCGLGPSDRKFGPDTYGTKIDPEHDLTDDEYHQVQAEIEAQAEAVDADIIVTPHHSCHLEWSKFGSERLPITHFTSLIAEALGVKVPDRFQILWRLGNPDKILEMTRPQWESWHLTEPEARQLVTRYFVPEYAAAVQQCPCDGDCFETIISPDVTSSVSQPVAALQTPSPR